MSPKAKTAVVVACLLTVAFLSFALIRRQIDKQTGLNAAIAADNAQLEKTLALLQDEIKAAKNGETPAPPSPATPR